MSGPFYSFLRAEPLFGRLEGIARTLAMHLRGARKPVVQTGLSDGHPIRAVPA